MCVHIGFYRFESHVLLSLCESVLVDQIEDSSVFQLLAVAELYNTQHLRVRPIPNISFLLHALILCLQGSAMQYILLRPDVIMQEVEGYSSLSESLRQELRDLLSGTQDPLLALRHSQPALPCVNTPLSSSHFTASYSPLSPSAGTRLPGIRW